MITGTGVQKRDEVKHQKWRLGARTKRSSEVDEHERLGEACEVSCRERILTNKTSQT